MDHERHIAKTSLLKCRRHVGEFSIFEDEEWNPKEKRSMKGWLVHCCVATNNFGRNALHKDHASKLLQSFVHVSRAS